MGERYICGDFDTSSSASLEEFMPDAGCGKDFVSKASLEDHIRTAHLSLPSVVNANRIKPSAGSDIENDDDEYKPRPKKKRGKGARVSAIDRLLGEPYTAENRNLSFHLCSAQQLAETDNQDPNFTSFDTGPAWPDMSLPMIERTEVTNGHHEQTPAADASREELDAMYDQTDIDWELQRRALEGGPFWIGAEEGEDAVPGQDSWMQEEVEMRRLIDGEGRDSVYPSLESS
jgi:general transcription factor IIIA